MSYMTKEKMPNGLNAICISKIDADHLQLLKKGGPDSVRLLLTVKPSDNPDEILAKIKGISSVSHDENPLVQ